MKLKNKLLPLIGAASVVATATPLALTSCKSNDNSEWINMLTPYSPTIEKYATCSMNETEANKAYFGDEDEWLDEEEVSERLMQDYLWSYSHGFEVDVGPSYWAQRTYNSYNIKFNYLKFGQATTYSDILHLLPITVPTISFEVEYETDITWNWYEEDVKYNYVDSGVLSITNLPITLAYNNVNIRDTHDSFYALTIICDYYTLSRTEKLQDTGNYYGKIPFSFVDEFKETANIITPDKTLTNEENFQRLYYSGCFSDSSDLEDFAAYYCPSFCSYYMLSVHE